MNRPMNRPINQPINQTVNLSRRLFTWRSVGVWLILLFTLSALLPQSFAQSGNRTKYADDLLKLHNRERAKVNAKALRIDDKLTTAAQKYADRLAKLDVLSHFADGSLGTRLKRVGARYSIAGENLAKGQGSPDSAVRSWMRSSGHRANIVNGRFGKAGFGVARTKKGALVWVAVFSN